MAEKLVQLLTVSAVGMVVLLSFGVVSSMAADQTIEATGSTLAWTPDSTVTVDSGGTVEFKSSANLPHGVNWEAPPATPSCPNVPTVGTASPWNGTCTFTQAGTYNFVCPVHLGMTGTVTVNATGPQPPIVTAENATNVTDSGATLRGSVNPSNQSTEYFFEYGTTTGYGEETMTVTGVTGTTSMPKTAAVTGLDPATTYHYRMVATNVTGTTNGADRTFTTAGPPTATTDPASAIGKTGATLKGTVNPKGLETKYFFNYGTTEAYGQKTEPEKSAGSGTSPVTASVAVAGLLPETTYHFQLVAKNSAVGGEVKGADRTFTTTATDPPVATTGQASGVGETAATLGGTVNPQGQETKYFFNYGTTTSYGQKTAEAGAGKGTANVGVSAPLAGLSPGTTYHFQLIAKSSGGESQGADQSFTTASSPPPPPAPPLPAPPVIPPPTGSAVPDTKITLKPAAKTRDTTPTIKFKATVGGASYQCSVDSKPFKTCRSPFTAPALKPGSHKIRVKATVGGVTDPSPASCSFKVLAKKRG